MKGSITTEHTIWCGHPDCIEFEQQPIATKQAMERVMKAKGWAKHSLWGWVCPNCAKK